MTFEDFNANIVDQDRGRWLDVVNPWTGEPIGLRLLIAGPDSDTQRKARLDMMDKFADAADTDGRLSSEARDKLRVGSLARCVLNWDVAASFGLDAAFGHAAVVKVLQIGWLQQQVDAFAGDRSHFRSEAA